MHAIPHFLSTRRLKRCRIATNRVFPSLGLGFKIQGLVSLNTATNSLRSDSRIHTYIDRETERHSETYVDTDKDKHMLTGRHGHRHRHRCTYKVSALVHLLYNNAPGAWRVGEESDERPPSSGP